MYKKIVAIIVQDKSNEEVKLGTPRYDVLEFQFGGVFGIKTRELDECSLTKQDGLEALDIAINHLRTQLIQ